MTHAFSRTNYHFTRLISDAVVYTHSVVISLNQRTLVINPPICMTGCNWMCHLHNTVEQETMSPWGLAGITLDTYVTYIQQ